MKGKNLFSNLFNKNKKEKKIIASFNEEELSFLKKANGLKIDVLAQDKKDIMLKFIDKGIIVKASNYDKLEYLTVATLQKILTSANLAKTGKKSELVERIKTSVSEEELSTNSFLSDDIYILSPLGKNVIKTANL